MPKTARNIWPLIPTFENVLEAYRAASKGRHEKPYVLQFSANLEANIFDIMHSLQEKTWKPGPWTVFTVYEPKMRVIHAPHFADRVAHHAVVRIIQPYFERRFIADSYACRTGKGTHAASGRLWSMLREYGRDSTAYFLKADISKYFPSIQHDILMQQVRRTISDKDVLNFLQSIVYRSGFDGVGLPIGALPSQLMANVYLDPFDHFVKDVLGIRHYIRYMDDFIILHHDKKFLTRTLHTVRQWLGDNSKLTLNRKTGIAPVSQGIDFAGYRHWSTHKLPRKRNVARAKRVFRKLERLFAAGAASTGTVRPVVASFCGYMKHCSGYRTCDSTLDNLVLRRAS